MTQTVGHVVSNYLGRSATFIYTTIRSPSAYRTVVLAGRTSNLSEFPFGDVHELVEADAGILGRVARRARALGSGFRHTEEFRLARAARAFDCVALHAHFGWTGARSLAARRRLGIPLVTTFYGRDLVDSRGLPYGDLFREGSLFCCEGPTMAEQLVRIGCPADKVRLLRIPLELGAFPFAPPRQTRRLIIVQACRFVEKKGVDVSIRAFAEARRQLDESELWLIGDGDLRPELESLAQELGVGSAVRFLGMISHEDYRAVIRHAHVCIQPSRTAADGDTEGGAPTVLLEMQATGIPVVATRHADIPYVVADPERLADEDDVDALAKELIRIASLSEPDWDALCERGRRFVAERHDAAVIAKERDGIYREALNLPVEPVAAHVMETARA